jgi:hypothetical protein
METPRMRRYRPLFERAAPPEPSRDDWKSWETLLTDQHYETEEGPRGAMRFDTGHGFATVASSLLALPSANRPELKPRFRFAGWKPAPSPWRDVLAG